MCPRGGAEPKIKWRANLPPRAVPKHYATRQEESGSRILVATRMQRAVGQAGRITRVIAAAICSHRERSSASRLRPVDVSR
jgi:hypothetical protein